MKSFDVEYIPTGWCCQIKIDETKAFDTIKAMVEFWHDWKHRLDMFEGDYIKTFVQQLARSIIYDIVENNHNICGVVNSFNDKEGWCKMDGSEGIWITDIDNFEFSFEDFLVGEVDNG